MKITVTVSGKKTETSAKTLEALAREVYPGHPDGFNPVVAALVSSASLRRPSRTARRSNSST